MLDAVVIGAGQAGLATSYFLKQHGLEHLVFERGEVGESWRSQRWDSFVLNTLNSMNGLPGAPWEGPMPDGFCTAGELAESFASYAKRFDLPVRAGATVTSVEQAGPNGAFVLRMTNGEGAETFDTRTVIIASGIMSAPNIPGMADSVPAGIVQRHAADYRNPADLPAGAVVVVGAGQSGCQIAEDLLDAGRKVYLCVSKVGRCPRRYRGRDIDDWLQDFGGWDVTREELADPAEVFVPQPQVSGVGRYGRSVSLQQLARDGAVLLGRISAVENNALLLEDNVVGCIRHADEVSATIKQKVEDYLAREGIEPPPREDDPADEPCADPTAFKSPDRLDLSEAGVSAIVWTTGFTADFSWLKLPALDESGRPTHERGVSPVPGLYFVGFPWLHKRKSGIIYGVEEDANHIVKHLADSLAAS
jgi:putative flavoprotein involved in K+ transport